MSAVLSARVIVLATIFKALLSKNGDLQRNGDGPSVCSPKMRGKAWACCTMFPFLPGEILAAGDGQQAASSLLTSPFGMANI